MDVTLPDGTVIKDVPEGTSKAELASKLQRSGYQIPPEWMGAPAQRQEPSISQKIVGGLEAGAAAITAPFAYLHGLASGGNLLVQRLLYEATGTPGGDQLETPEAAFARGAAAEQYVPRTEVGKDYAQNVAGAMESLAPLPGMAGEAQSLSQALRVGAGTAAPLAAAAAKNAGTAVKAAPSAVSEAFSAAASKVSKAFGMGEEAARTDGGSVGAAGVERARRLTETAQQLPVPVKLTKGEATGDLNAIRFEQEQAKSALGAPIREQSAATNKALGQNIEALIDRTGSETTSNIEAGRVVTGELAKAAAREKAKYRALYNAADKAGEMSDPVDLQPVANYLNENRAGRSSAPIMNVLDEQVKVQGVGSGSLANGDLSIGPMNLKQAEQLRKSINRFVKDTDPNDVRVATDIKRLIDESTDGAGGSTYIEARKARQRYSQLFEDNAIVSDLLKTRRGTADRQVALEDVFRRTVLGGSREDLGMLRRTLDVADQRQGIAPGTTGSGAQAWKELQGATLRNLLDEAQKGFAVDQAGAQRFSGAQLNKAIRDLERGGKMDFLFGKKTAQTIRDINEIARAVQAFPAGAVNSSNTASVVLAALAEAGTTGALTGLPVPAVSLLRAGAQAIKDNKTRARITASLNYKPGAQ